MDDTDFTRVTVQMPDRPVSVQAIPYCDKRDARINGNAGPIRLFMLLSLFSSDHAVTYLFFDKAPTVDRVAAFAELNKEGFGHRLVVVEMGQAFDTIEDAEDQANMLRVAFPKANLMFPPAVLLETNP